jgi:molybdate transport system substrate-binding protein
MSRSRRLLFAFGLAACPAALQASEVMVFAAASLTNVLQELAPAFEGATGNHAVFNFAASSTLARQIEEGAPADVFFSADEARMDALERDGLILVDTRQTMLSNALVIVTAAASKLDLHDPKALATPTVRVLALAEPQSVPAGIYAKEYLRRLGLWSKVVDKVVPTENVRAALAVVESGNADAGIVYRSDAAASARVRVAYEVPAADAPTISYPVAVLAGARDAAAGRSFVAFLSTPAAKGVFRRALFVVPE